MRNDTRNLFNAYLGQLTKLHGVPDVTTKFATAPSVTQILETRMQESSQFLSAINIYGVTEQMGEKIGMGIGGPNAGTTDTTQKDRETTDITALDDRGYFCSQTNFDTHLRYSKLDAWTKRRAFETRSSSARRWTAS